jgi:predicted secreted protein
MNKFFISKPNCRDCFAEATEAEARVLAIYPYADGYAVFESTYNQCAASGDCCKCLPEIIVTP